MAVTEETRYEVHKYFEETMGSERAGTLMAMLPPVGWGDVATKQDLRQLREWASERFATKQDLSRVHIDLHKEIRAQTYVLLTAMVAIAGLLTVRLG